MTGQARRYPVEAAVTAEMPKPVVLRLLPYRVEPVPPDDSIVLPWAWVATVRVRFRIGELSITKRVSCKYAYSYKDEDRPSDEALAEGRDAVLANLRTQLARHGFTPPAFLKIDEEVAA